MYTHIHNLVHIMLEHLKSFEIRKRTPRLALCITRGVIYVHSSLKVITSKYTKQYYTTRRLLEIQEYTIYI